MVFMAQSRSIYDSNVATRTNSNTRNVRHSDIRSNAMIQSMKKEFIDRINTNDETKFIFQSNAIEGEWGEREFAHAMEAWEYLKAQDEPSYYLGC